MGSRKKSSRNCDDDDVYDDYSCNDDVYCDDYSSGDDC